MDQRKDGRTEFIPTLKDFVPYRGRRPAATKIIKSLPTGNRVPKYTEVYRRIPKYTEAHRSPLKLTVSYQKLPGISPKSVIFSLKLTVSNWKYDCRKSGSKSGQKKKKIYRRPPKFTKAHGTLPKTSWNLTKICN